MKEQVSHYLKFWKDSFGFENKFTVRLISSLVRKDKN